MREHDQCWEAGRNEAPEPPKVSMEKRRCRSVLCSAWLGASLTAQVCLQHEQSHALWR